jgi:chaperonin GroEL
MFGVKIIAKAIQAPLREISANAGLEGAIVINKVREQQGNYGYNAATDQYGDLMQMGVIDPVKVVRSALQNASSVAGLMLTTEALVAERPKEEKKAPPGGGHTHGGEMDF